jgi:hypothetical protein
MPRFTTASSQKANKRFVGVNPKLENQLCAYAVTMGASAVALLAAAQPASAEIVYTPVNVAVGDSYAIDLNGDGVVDFTLERFIPYRTQFLALDYSVKGNAVRPPVNKDDVDAAALPAGAMIGKGQSFTTATSYGGAIMAVAFAYGTVSNQGGPWISATNKYLGLKFLINGKFHYGWARLTVGSYKGDNNNVTLTGYAYETVPGRMLHAGQKTEEADVETASQDTDFAPESTLGSLALGINGLSASR